MWIRTSVKFNLISLLLLLCLSSCATQLAPSYDEAVFNGLTAVNIEIMSLFSSVAAGSRSSDFEERKNNYDQAIGKIEALAIQARARPFPINNLEKINDYLRERDIPILLDSSEIPSASALDQISQQLVQMRETDESRGLSAGVVPIFKNAVIISMDQALTYESFLER